jgi:Amt family ammonium transporter
VGLFATGQYGIPGADGADNSVPIEGLFYGGGGEQLLAQVIGSLTCVVVVLAIGLLVMSAIRRIPGTWNLRVEEDGELEGLDLFEHGITAYHMEFGHGMGYTTPPTLSGGTLFGSSSITEKENV